MSKSYGPDINIKLHSRRCLINTKLYSKIEEILKVYTQNITSLEMIVTGREEMFLHPELIFSNLRSLKLKLVPDRFNYYLKESSCSILKEMINKHVNMEALQIENCWDSFELKEPAVPKLQKLSLTKVRNEIALSLFSASRNNITSFELTEMEICVPSPMKIFKSFYLMPKIQNLTITHTSSYNFLLYNPSKLVSLNLSLCYEQYLKSFEWPDLPNLKELIIQGKVFLPILYKCKNTLEYLEFHSTSYSSEKYLDDFLDVGVMPKLTDLFLVGRLTFCPGFLALNKQSLQFLFLNNVEYDYLPCQDEGLTLDKMKTVVMISSYPKFYKYKDQDRKGFAALCPNAKVIFVKNAGTSTTKKVPTANTTICSRSNLTATTSEHSDA